MEQQNQIDDRPPRIVGFLADLETPHVIKKGSIIQVTAEFKDELVKDFPAGRAPVCDLTLLRTSASLLGAFGDLVSALPKRTISTIIQRPCPHCYNDVGVSLCLVCKGKRRLVNPIEERMSRKAAENQAIQRARMVFKFVTGKELTDKQKESMLKHMIPI